VLRALLLIVSLLSQAPLGAAQTDLDLTVNFVQEDGAALPTGIRILRAPPDLDSLSPAAWIERSQVRRGKWRPLRKGSDEMVIRLHPTPEVSQYSWRVVAFQENSMLSFRMASESFREFAVGVSEIFPIDPAGGKATVVVPLQAPIYVEPLFEGIQPPPGAKFSYLFSYGLMGKAPRHARGDWNGVGILPITLSPLALNRPASLSMELQQLPCAFLLDPIEFQLLKGKTSVVFPSLPKQGALNIQIPGGGRWDVAVGYVSPDGEAQVQSLGNTDALGKLHINGVRAGKYHLLATPATDSPPRPGAQSARRLVEFNGSSTVSSQIEPEAHFDAITLQEALSQSDFNLSFATQGSSSQENSMLNDFHITVRCMWGPFFLYESILTPSVNRTCRLPMGPEFEYQAIAHRWNEALSGSEVRLFLNCQIEGNRLKFRTHDTVMEVDGYQDDTEYTLRLIRGEQGPNFPPLQWFGKPLSLTSFPYLPISFNSMIQIHGLPEGSYEASMWGWDRIEETVTELSYHYPVAD